MDRKKLYLFLLGGLSILGILFVIFAVFINRGTLEINAEPPYMANIGNIKSVSCSESPCKIDLAPGRYQVRLEKNGYKPFEFLTNIPIWATRQESAEFFFIPTFEKLGAESDLHIFEIEANTIPEKISGLMGNAVPYFGGNYVAFITRSKENGRQTLFYSSQDDEAPEEVMIAASFTRDLKDFRIAPSIEENGKIAVLDRVDNNNTVYLIDLADETRKSVLQMPSILDIKWIGKKRLLIDGAAEGEPSGLYMVDFNEGATPLRLAINTPLDNVFSFGEDEIIVYSGQNYSAAGTPAEGDVIDLTEEKGESFNFLLIKDGATRFLKKAGVECKKLRQDERGLFCLAELDGVDTVYHLTVSL